MSVVAKHGIQYASSVAVAVIEVNCKCDGRILTSMHFSLVSYSL